MHSRPTCRSRRINWPQLIAIAHFHARTNHHDELLRRKRELHLRIGRSRRRIDGRLRATKDHARQLLSWRTYVVRYPGWALVAALGAGMAASTALRPARVSRWLAGTLMRQAFGGVRQQLGSELRRIWSDSTPDDMIPPNDRCLPTCATRLSRLGAELREMAAARWELARLELAADLRSARRLAIAWLAVGRTGADGVAAAGGAVWPKRWTAAAGIPRGGWLLIFAGGLLVLALAGGYLAWRRFRRKFIGLRETMEELREDMVWLREKGKAGRRTE